MVMTKNKHWTDEYIARFMGAASIGDRSGMDQVLIDVANNAMNGYDAFQRQFPRGTVEASLDELMSGEKLVILRTPGTFTDTPPPPPPPVHTITGTIGTAYDTTAIAEPQVQLRFKDMPDPDNPTKWRKTLQQLHKITPRMAGTVHFEWRDVRVEV